MTNTMTTCADNALWRCGTRAIAAALASALVLGLAGCGSDSPKRTFNTAPYVGHGNVADCTTFKSQAHAQAVLRADPVDRNGLDLDGDGVACAELPAPKDTDAVERVYITDKDGAPIDPNNETSKRKRASGGG